MIRVICDTMIWYNLAKGKLEPPDPEQYTLVCTYLSLTEIAFTPNNFGNLSEIQDVINSILTQKPEFIMTSAMDHARTLIDTSFTHEYNVTEDLVLAFLKVILNQPKDGLIESKFKDQLSEISRRRKDNHNDWAMFVNNLYGTTKSVTGVLKRFHDDKADINRFRKWFVLNLNQFREKQLSADKINWNNFEFYEKISARYWRNMALTKMRADRNDQTDLDNMVYVQPGDKYWTLEKRWLSIAKEAKADKYLYRPK